MILMGKAQKDHKDYADFLKQVPILQHLKEEELKDMASYLKEEVIASPFMNHIRAPTLLSLGARACMCVGSPLASTELTAPFVHVHVTWAWACDARRA